MRAVHGEHLKFLTLHAADPAGNVVRFSVRDTGDRILKFRQASLPLGKLVEFAQCDPTLVLSAVAAEDGRYEVANYRSGKNHDRQSVQ